MAVYIAGGGMVPKRVQFVGHIQSSGTQYIDTGIKPNNNTRVVAKFQILNKTSAFQAVFGSRGPATGYANRFCFYLSGSGYFRSDYGTSNQNFPSDIPQTETHTVDKNRNLCTIGSSSKVTHSAEVFSGTFPVYLLGNNTGGTPSELGGVRLYSCQIYDNDTLIRDYHPALDSNGIACLYDAVSDSFFYNAGTGEFIAGGAV